jgi:hypothetical protein
MKATKRMKKTCVGIVLVSMVFLTNGTFTVMTRKSVSVSGTYVDNVLTPTGGEFLNNRRSNIDGTGTAMLKGGYLIISGFTGRDSVLINDTYKK